MQDLETELNLKATLWNASGKPNKKEGLSENCKRTSGKKTERGHTQLEVDHNQEWRDPDNIYTLQVMREEEKGGSTANTKCRIMKQGK